MIMTNELKDRISKIRSGEVPEGYKKTKMGILPNDWNIVKLKDIAQHITKKNSEMKYTETLTNSAALGIINQTDYFEKQISNNNNIDGYYVVEEGDYAYNPRISVSAPCGPISKSHISETGIMSPLYTVFRFSDIDDSYYESYFKSSFWYRYMNSVANYGARFDRMNITNDDFFSMPLPSPPLPEQQKIAEILSTQDKVIALIQKQIEELKKLKKAYLQKMFPQKGSLFPEIRFKGFTDAWEQRELGECMKTVTDYVAAGSFADIADHVQYKNTPDYAQLIRTVDLKHEFRNNDYIYVDKKAFDYLWRVNLNEECIILPNIGANIGEVYYIEPLSLPYEFNVLGPNAILLKTKDSTKFMFTLLQADDFQNKLYVSIASSGQPKFNKTELKSIKLLLPKPDEQEKIGQYFAHIDNLITLHQRKLEQEQQKKKALMQLLLTGIVRVKV